MANLTVVHLHNTYNARLRWDVNLLFIQFAYNNAIHGSHMATIFEVCLSFLPITLFSLALVKGQDVNSTREQLKLQSMEPHCNDFAMTRRRHSSNAYNTSIAKLDLLPYMIIHTTVNFNNLYFFDPSTFESEAPEILHLMNDLVLNLEGSPSASPFDHIAKGVLNDSLAFMDYRHRHPADGKFFLCCHHFLRQTA